MRPEIDGHRRGGGRVVRGVETIAAGYDVCTCAANEGVVSIEAGDDIIPGTPIEQIGSGSRSWTRRLSPQRPAAYPAFITTEQTPDTFTAGRLLAGRMLGALR